MIRTIAVALEGAAASEVALRYAVRVARWHDARLVMLCPAREEDALEPEFGEAEMGFGEEPDAGVAELMLESAPRVTDHPLVDAAAALCGQHRVAWRAEGCVGAPARHLARFTARADIVAVSRRGASGAPHELPRHVFAVLRASPRAVLVTPETYQEPQVVVAAYDGSSPAARGLALAAETSLRAQLPLTVVSVGSNGAAAARLSEARRYLAAYAGQTELVSREGDPVRQLTAITFELGGTLLVMGAYGRSAWRRFLSLSRTERILRGCHGPALAVR